MLDAVFHLVSEILELRCNERAIIFDYHRGTNAFVFYGLSLNSINLSGNIYLNFILGCLIEIPGNTIAWVRTWNEIDTSRTEIIKLNSMLDNNEQSRSQNFIGIFTAPVRRHLYCWRIRSWESLLDSNRSVLDWKDGNHRFIRHSLRVLG